jgi:PAS domain S-box-containing protein
MPVQLRILMLEDEASDAALVLRKLREAGLEPLWQQVETEADYLAQLSADWDLILADYCLPQFDAPRALRLMQERGLEIPFIIISGAIDEELAVAALKQGATDYLFKDRLGRLGQAVTQALEQKHLADAKRSVEDALRHSEERYRRIVDTMNEGVWMLDQSARTSYVNHQMAEMLGYAVPELLGREVFDFLDPATRLEAEPNFGRRAPRLKEQYDFRFRRQDGSDLWAIFTTSPLLDEQGQFIGTLGVVTDITERRRAEGERQRLETQLFQAQKMESIGTLAGGVAHDFNNLLTAILGNTQLLRRRMQMEPKLQGFLADIESAAQRASALTQQLLAFSRRQHLKRVTINLNELLSNFIKMLQRIIGEDVEVRLHVAPSLAPVYVDPAQIEQVVMNLAVNARDAMPGGGQLLIETHHVMLDEAYCQQRPWAKPGPYVQLIVSDTGCGMDAETRQHIFEPFFTTKELGKGTGLGLSVVYGIIKQHDALIHVYSEVGQGSAFKLYFPVAEQREVETPAKAQEEPRGGTETILVAEDEEALCRLAQSILQELGYKVLVARDGQEAVDLFAAHRGRIDLMLLDVIMPRLGGWEAFEQIRKLGGTRPAIFMTGYSSEKVQSQPSAAAGAVVMEKPYTIQALGLKVREVLDQAAQQ